MTSPPARMAGEVAVITGATSGLGIAIARRFHAEGAAVVLTGRRSEVGRALVAGYGERAAFVPADLADAGAGAAIVAAAHAAFGRVTVVVNNAVDPAAIAADGPVDTVADDVWRAMFEVSVLGSARLVRAAIPTMVAAGGGAVVNVTSRVAARGTPGLAAYASAKAGLDALSRSIVADHGRQGIRANTVQPGYIVHDERDAGRTDADLAHHRRRQVTRLATADDVAAAVAFLASRDAACIAGVTLPVDGGSTALRAAELG